MEPRREHGRKVEYVVLSRAHAGLYDEMVSLFAVWPEVEVVVDRRRKPRSGRQPAARRSAQRGASARDA